MGGDNRFFFADANMPEPWADSVFFWELHQIVTLKALNTLKEENKKPHQMLTFWFGRMIQRVLLAFCVQAPISVADKFVGIQQSSTMDLY